ncbi:DNA repair RAD52-like protein 2 [Cardamine amara subsp. amara]|uniref:DNA repair RAD52-like protein 2 n=1 Tax=Cardamine amara subsp. amara TaxID=228776 RepID=A0ABD1BF90_CARAN
MALQIQSSTAFTISTPSNARTTLSPFRTIAIPRTAFQGGVRCSSGGVGGDAGNKKSVPNSNYVVPMDKFSSSTSITRPLIEILRDLNKKIPDNIVMSHQDPRVTTASSGFIPWYHANRMLSFYAPGWCGEVRDVIFSENGNVTVVYRLTIRGSDGEAHRESTGTVTTTDDNIDDPVAAAEEIAFCRACARFGLGLYLYHEQ